MNNLKQTLTMQAWMKDPKQGVIDGKAELLARMPDVAERMVRMNEWLGDEVAAVNAEGADAVPQMSFRDVLANGISAAQTERIRRRGCVIIRGVFERQQAVTWNEEIERYIDENDYYEKAKTKVGLDKYFSALAAGRPQIFGLYWSQPQMQARQHENMDAVRGWLNRLWNFTRPDGTPEFIPDRQCNYADRIRRREPGDKTLGLSAHCDGGSIERWCDASFQRVYHEVFFGNPAAYDPFNAVGRTLDRAQATAH
jgi:hypothetical protein